MKKLWILGLTALLIVPFTTGCAVSNEYKNLHNEIVDFTTNSIYTEFFDGNITFNSGVQSEKTSPSSHYYTITYYEQIIEVSLSTIKNFSTPFESVPKFNTNQTKRLCSDVINNINSFKTQVDNFNIKKANMDSAYNFSSSGGEQTFNEFKTDLGLLTKSANNLQVSFMNALTTLYYPIQNTDGDISPSRVECGALQTLSTLVDDYVNFAILEYNYEHPATTFQIYNAINQLYSTIATSSNVSTAKFGEWLGEYQLFKNEHDMFRTALNNVDIIKGDTNLTGESKAYFNKVMHYVNSYNSAESSSQIFVNKTIQLLYTNS